MYAQLSNDLKKLNYTQISIIFVRSQILKPKQSSPMKTQISKTELKQLIASGQEKEALNKLMEIVDFQNADTQQFIFILSNRFKKLQKELLVGNISSENAAVRSADINYDLLNLIDQISFDPPKKITPVQPTLKEIAPQKKEFPKVPAKKAPSTKVISIAALGLILLAALFYFTNQMFNSEPVSYKKNWLGEWSQEKEADGKVMLSGSIYFYRDEYGFKGKSNNVLLTGENNQDSLFNIRFSEKGKKMKGNWISSDVRFFPELEGTFLFELNTEDKKSFTGKYSSRIQKSTLNKNKEFVWNGIKKE